MDRVGQDGVRPSSLPTRREPEPPSYLAAAFEDPPEPEPPLEPEPELEPFDPLDEAGVFAPSEDPDVDPLLPDPPLSEVLLSDPPLSEVPVDSDEELPLSAPLPVSADFGPSEAPGAVETLASRLSLR